MEDYNMKATLRLINLGNIKKDIISYSIHIGYGFWIGNHMKYSTIVNAIKSAKRIAKKLNICINNIEYRDKNFKTYRLN
jgi:hypothetical protein